MPRTKGSRNRVTASTDFDAQIAKMQKDKAVLEEGLSETVTWIEELKTDITSPRECLKPQVSATEGGNQTDQKEITKLETKKDEVEVVRKNLLSSGMTADDILENLK